MASEGAVKIAGNLAVLLNVPLFVTWLNNLNSTEAIIKDYFGKNLRISVTIEITKRRNLLLITCVLLFGILTTTVQYLYLYPLHPFNLKFWLLRQFCFASVQYLFVLEQQLEDVKHVLMLTAVKRMYLLD